MQLPAQDKRYKSSIPKEAIEKVRSRYPDGSVEYTDYFEKGEKVGSRHWEQEGTLGWEGPFKGGVKHGREYDWVAGIYFLWNLLLMASLTACASNGMTRGTSCRHTGWSTVPALTSGDAI